MAKHKVREIVVKRKLDEFYSDEEFFKDFKKIMSHDNKRHNYLFHGTQDIPSAYSILNEGLAMMSANLLSTTYPEFSMDDVLLYRRGFFGEIGKDAVVIIDQPINEDGEPVIIVQMLEDDNNINFVQSGLQGLNGKARYIVNPKYIVGFVNKRDKKGEFNPLYYAYYKKTPLQQKEAELALLEEEERAITRKEEMIKQYSEQELGE